MDRDHVGAEPHESDVDERGKEVPLFFEMPGVRQERERLPGNVVLVEEIEVVGDEVAEEQTPLFPLEGSDFQLPRCDAFRQQIQIAGEGLSMIADVPGLLPHGGKVRQKQSPFAAFQQTENDIQLHYDGTVNTLSEDNPYSILYLKNACSHYDKQVFVAPIDSKLVPNPSTKAILDAKIKPLYDMPFEAAWAYLMLSTWVGKLIKA